MKKIILFCIFYLASFISRAQVADHWETIVEGSGLWKYLAPVAQPDSDWNSVNYIDTTWNSGKGSIGYGDGDDSTVISPALSVSSKQKFLWFL